MNGENVLISLIENRLEKCETELFLSCFLRDVCNSYLKENTKGKYTEFYCSEGSLGIL